MEIKANFLLIGAFTLAGMAAILGAFVWLGALRVDRDVARYGILFNDVSGLARAGEVVFNGLTVGRVVDMRLHDADPSLVYVEIEVEPATPVRADTVAQLTVQGVTGLAYVALLGGTMEAPPLPVRDDGLPLIPSRRTGLQSLMADVPDLARDIQGLVADLRGVLGPEAQAQVANILTNVDEASSKFNATLDGMEGLTTGLSDAAEQISALGETVGRFEGDLRTTLERADAALVAIEEAANSFAPAMAGVQKSAETVENVLAIEGREALTEGRDALVQWRTVGAEMGPLISRTGDTMETVRGAARDLGALAQGDAAAILAEARAALEGAGPALQDDLPAALSDLRSASAAARAAVEESAQAVSTAAAQLDPLATEARAAVQRANDLLDRAGPSLDQLDRAVGSADEAFRAASTLIESDLAPAMGDLRAAADAIARDLPEITALARSAVGDLSTAITTLTPGLRTLAGSTLPQLDRLAGETRALIGGMADLLRRIERDPGSVLQGGRVPEYRR